MIQPGTVIEIEGHNYRVKYRDTGFPHSEDAGLLRCEMIALDQFGRMSVCDDDDWLISDDLRIVAREVGWDLKRFKPGDWGFDRYMKW